MNENNTSLMDKLFRVETLLSRYHVQCFKSQAHGNPMRGQGRVLSLLKIKESISQKELSYLLDMRQQSLSELLMKLEKKGYITRTVSEDDRRVSMITLTEEGAKAAPDEEAGELGGARVMDCLNEDERKLFGEYLDRVAEALEKELPDMEQSGAEGQFFGRRGGMGHGGRGHREFMEHVHDTAKEHLRDLHKHHEKPGNSDGRDGGARFHRGEGHGRGRREGYDGRRDFRKTGIGWDDCSTVSYEDDE